MAGRIVPMQRRAGSVWSKSTCKAAETGRMCKFVPRGGNGPIQLRYRSGPVISGLTFSIYGERGREVDGFIEELARKGGSTPGRCGCCHGVGQAIRIARFVLGAGAHWSSGVAEVGHGHRFGPQHSLRESGSVTREGS